MKYKHLITVGIEQNLSSVQFHYDAPLKRYVMLQRDKVDGDGGLKIVSHIIHNLPETITSYSELHRHEFDEINLVLSEDNSLKYRIRLEDETYEVVSPTTIFIPKGIKHAAEVISGKGIFLVIIFTKDYKAQQ